MASKITYEAPCGTESFKATKNGITCEISFFESDINETIFMEVNDDCTIPEFFSFCAEGLYGDDCPTSGDRGLIPDLALKALGYANPREVDGWCPVFKTPEEAFEHFRICVKLYNAQYFLESADEDLPDKKEGVVVFHTHRSKFKLNCTL